MGDSREAIKKAFGLPEYPWSSDDEDIIITPDNATSRRQADSSEFPDDSGVRPSTSGQSRRRMGRVERDFYWSLLDNPTRASGPSAVPGRSTASVQTVMPGTSRSLEPRESIDLTSPLSNLQRILAIKRLPRGQPSSRNCMFPFQLLSNLGNISRRSSDSSSPMNVQPSSPTDDEPLVRYTALPRISVTRSSSQENRNALAGNSENRNDSANSLEGRNPMVVNTSTGRVAIAANVPPEGAPHAEVRQELVMEIDGDDNQPDDNVLGQAQASGAEEETEEPELAEDATTASLATSLAQGTKRKREVTATDGSVTAADDVFTAQDLNRSLLQLLECPVCLEWMEPPMAQCRRGHLVCLRCRTRLASCPVCRTAFSSVRNRAMEGVADILRYPCRHGCGRETRLRQRGAHEASCTARRYRCPAATCARQEPMPLTDLPQHFQTCHQSILKVGSRHQFSIRMNLDQHDDWLIMVGRDLFFMRVDVSVRTLGIVVHVAYIGPKCNANLFTYEVSVCGLHNERKLVYTRETHSDLESTSLNVNRQDCFHLTLDQALNFLRYKNRHCEPDKLLEFSVEISKIDPPAQNETPCDLDS
ncbi:uncharacterized protein LOC112055816 isoform X2 [Bicyclus anynana]|uniref:Uncharacterized protein LOC112055816 isoform X2 n=1 Tax=Bicyclus anynana TaxID=110368 RepID=A0ABM3LGW8_BICAN|nr:uncharacterized protein LOC112055816 isoform X2 [Bicyclus anynana]